MKGFSRRETVDYYRTIMEQAWAQVEAADTPEVKSEKFDEVMEWTMLDKDYDDRTKEVFRESPVFVPVWWPRYDPTFSGPVARPTSGPIATGGPSVPSGSSMPTLPGSAFAASVVNGCKVSHHVWLGTSQISPMESRKSQIRRQNQLLIAAGDPPAVVEVEVAPAHVHVQGVPVLVLEVVDK
jgi:hypothetical protein